ncbi:MAG: argininosuccinate lyase, partial [Proteiniphilum sp.]|nr:argininosuccinate lyase [Proteiniphilum sp.]
IETMHSLLQMSHFMLQQIEVNREILNDSKYDYLFTVEEVNKRVLKGVPFREAYQQVGREVEEGSFKAEKQVIHTHEGSIGNLCTEQIKRKMSIASEGIR